MSRRIDIAFEEVAVQGDRKAEGKEMTEHSRLEFSSLTAAGKKLLLSLMILFWMLLSCLPEGRGRNIE